MVEEFELGLVVGLDVMDQLPAFEDDGIRLVVVPLLILVVDHPLVLFCHGWPGLPAEFGCGC